MCPADWSADADVLFEINYYLIRAFDELVSERTGGNLQVVILLDQWSVEGPRLLQSKFGN